MIDDIVSKLVGYDLPYSWQLMHEIIIDDEFKFSTDIFIITNPEIRRVVEMILCVVDLECAEALRDALVADTILNKGDIGKELLDTTLNKLKKMFTQMTEIDADECFDTNLIYQMLVNQSYTLQQMSALVTFVCQSVVTNSKHDDCTAATWERLLLLRISSTRDRPLDIIGTLVYVLFKLISMLKEERVSVTNKNVKLFRHLFKNSRGLQYEREQVVKALESGELTLDITHMRICQAVKKTNLSGLGSLSAINAVVGSFIHQFLVQHSLTNDEKLLPYKIPEILMLDTERLSQIRCEIRLLGCSLTVWNICKAVLSSYPINNEFIDEILSILTKVSGVDDIDSRLRSRFECVPTTMRNILSKSLSRDPNGLRGLLTKRIIDYTASRNVPVMNKALTLVSSRIEVVRNKVQMLCEHYDAVYAPLFQSIINEKL